MKTFKPFLYGSFLLLLLTGCGYTTKSTLAGHLKTIYVEPFKNSISYSSEGRRNLYFPLLEVDARNAIISRFLFDGNLKIAREGEADLILKGELIRYERNGLSFTDNDDVKEYRIHIYVSLELFDTHINEIFWTEPSFIGEATYFVSGPQVKSEEAAVDEAIVDLARRIVERTIENW